jgi:anti-sigma factor RsiW
MECGEFALRLDDLLDGRLDALGRKSIEEHLERCPDCRMRYGHAMALLESVRKLTPPALHPGFIDQALARATRPAAGAARAKWRPVLGMALAASLVLGVALGVFLVTRPDPVQAVALTIDRPETVRLMFNSAKPLKAATVSIALPENVELVGYGGRRELSWQTDLREGGNLLQLPLVVRGATKQDLVASLSHGGSSKTFRLKIEIGNAGRSGM